MRVYGYTSVRGSRRFGLPSFLDAVFLLSLIAPAGMARAGFLSDEVFLPAVGRLAGALGAQFYTTVWATNLSGAPVSFTFQFLRQGQANTSPASFTDLLAAGETKVYENVVESKLGLTSAIGAARITATGEILVSERIYNQPSGAGIDNTEGLFFAGVPQSFSIHPGESASIQGIDQGDGENFRYNFALVETGGGTPTVNVQVLDGSGALLGQKSYLLSPFEQIQPNVTDVVPAIATTNARITATVTGGSGAVLLAGAQLANVSQDSSGFEMSFKGSLLGGGSGVTSLNGLVGAVTLTAGTNVTFGGSGNNIIINAASGGGGGLSAVSHDASLAGDGTGGNPLGLAIPLIVTGGFDTVKLINGSVAVYGDSEDPSNAGVGVWGHGQNIGTYGEVVDGSSTVHAWGELGRFFSGGYLGVVGIALDNTAGTEALYAQQGFGSGATPAVPVGAWGDSHDGMGVFGSSSYNVLHGQSYGVHGEGVVGVEGSGTVTALNGSSTLSYGVEGDSYLVGDLRVGLFGYASGGTDNFAGYFVGPINVNGTIHTSGAVIRMDDPVDPENLYLSHAVVESPDMMNIYNGEVTLDGNGMAVVELPRWFEALNRDFRYQLTALDQAQPALHVARRIEGNRFTVAGGVPGGAVSWQVTGVRHDAWANAHRVPVESEKPKGERGLFLHPAELGLAADKGIDWERSPASRRAESPRP